MSGDAANRFRAALNEARNRQAPALATAAGTQAGGTDRAEAATPRAPTTPAALRFATALELARDPANASMTGSVRVTGHSDWRLDPCRVCRHSFREGDQAWLELAEGKIRAMHDSRALPCHSGAAPPETLSPGATRFTSALWQRYEVARPFRVIVLLPGHPLLRGDFAARRTCKGCGHTFRPYERVARCPCSPGAPSCRLYAHRDPARSQFCFDLLANPDREHCPMDWHKLPKKAAR